MCAHVCVPAGLGIPTGPRPVKCPGDQWKSAFTGPLDQSFFQEATNTVLLACTGRHTDSAVTVLLGTSEHDMRRVH